MTKPKQVPAVVAPFDCRNPFAPTLDVRSIFKISSPAGDKPARGRRMPFEYNPGPASVILLKIMAMEHYSANVSRLARQRKFCSRVKGS
jgi:hypothetical protein